MVQYITIRICTYVCILIRLYKVRLHIKANSDNKNLVPIVFKLYSDQQTLSVPTHATSCNLQLMRRALTDIRSRKRFMMGIWFSTKLFIKYMYSSLTPNLVKLARLWTTLATSVSFRLVLSSGYSEHTHAHAHNSIEEGYQHYVHFTVCHIICTPRKHTTVEIQHI